MIYKINLAKMRFQILIFILFSGFFFRQPVNAEFLQDNVPSGQIAFVKWVGKNGELQREVCVVYLDVDREKCITNTSDKDETNPQWSPDGKILAYQVTDLPLGNGKTETHLYDLEK